VISFPHLLFFLKIFQIQLCCGKSRTVAGRPHCWVL